jgi:hypothetical protein
MPRIEIEYRRCQFCKRSSAVYHDGGYLLVKYGVRHYAHPRCIATRRGRLGAKALIPQHQHRDFDIAMLDATEWDNQMADVVDQRNARAKDGAA